MRHRPAVRESWPSLHITAPARFAMSKTLSLPKRPQSSGADQPKPYAARKPRPAPAGPSSERQAQPSRGLRPQGPGNAGRPGQDSAASGRDRAPLPAAARPPRPAARSDSRDASEPVRLNKRLSDLGLCSRREGDDWIERGWVKVNGQTAQMGQQVTALDRIEVAPQATAQQGARVTILLHKPIGYVSGLPEDGHESAAVLVQPRTRWKEDRTPRRFEAGHTRGLAPAGRLDIDSTGLLILTQDGRVAKALIGEDSEVEKEYLVRVHWAPNGPKGVGVVMQNPQAVFPPERLALLRHGLSLDGQPLRSAQVEWQNDDQLRFVLKEGKKRQIRRMCEQVGLHVVGLKRIRIGRVMLGNLPLGQWRFLGENERF